MAHVMEGSPGSAGGAAAGDVRIRAMTAADLTAVLAIEKEVFSIPWTLATFTGLLDRENTRLWVAEIEGMADIAGATGASAGTGASERGVPRGAAARVVGYAALWMVADQAELGDIAVTARWRGRGIGTRLLATVVRTMEGAGVRELFLEVRESNTQAQRLYARHGFTEVGRRRGYYTRPKEDALVLRRLVEPRGPSRPVADDV